MAEFLDVISVLISDLFFLITWFIFLLPGRISTFLSMVYENVLFEQEKVKL